MTPNKKKARYGNARLGTSPGPGRSMRRGKKRAWDTHKQKIHVLFSFKVHKSASGGGELGPCRRPRESSVKRNKTAPFERHSKQSAGRSDVTTDERKEGGVPVFHSTPKRPENRLLYPPTHGNNAIMAKLNMWEGVKKGEINRLTKAFPSLTVQDHPHPHVASTKYAAPETRPSNQKCQYCLNEMKVPRTIQQNPNKCYSWAKLLSVCSGKTSRKRQCVRLRLNTGFAVIGFYLITART